MARIDIPYFVACPGRGGAARYYWQPSTVLRKLGWRPERLPDDLSAAVARAKALNAQLNAWRQGDEPAEPGRTPARGPAPGSMADLIMRYKASRFWTKLAPKTRRDYDQSLTLLADWAGDAPVAAITPQRVQKLYEPMHGKTPAKANAVIRVLRLLLQHGIREGMTATNAAARPGLVGAPPSGVLWPRDLVALVVEAADKAGRPSIGTAVLLAWWLGQREGDILALKRSDYRDGTFVITQRKTGARVAVPHSPIVAARVEAELKRLDAGKVSSTHIIVSEATGRPYDEHHFRHTFADVRALAAMKWPAWLTHDDTATPTADMKYRHLRHTALTELAAAGCTVPEIAAISGHSLRSVEQILERYFVRTSALASSATTKRLAIETGRE